MLDPYYTDDQVTLYAGDSLHVLRTLPDGSVGAVVTSPPYYGLRDYGTPGQYGLEDTPADYVATLRAVFAEVGRILAPDGTLWLNLGDTYNNRTRGQWRGSSDGFTSRADSPRWQRQSAIPEKSMIGIPWRVAFALQDDGWILRNAIIWHKPNAMPESVTDRLATRYEHLFLFTRSPRYWFNLDAIREPSTYQGRSWRQRRAAGEPAKHGTAGAAAVGAGDFNPHQRGRNPGDVWSISTRPYTEAHFATWPIDLPLRCITAGAKPAATVLDPFSGSGTTGAAARLLAHPYIGIDLNPAYHDLALKRFSQGVIAA